MSEAGLSAGALDLRSAPGAAASERVIQSRHRDHDFALRRALLIADLLGLCLALLLAIAIPGSRGAPLNDLLWLLPTLPAWAFLFRAYGLYLRPVRRFEPSHLDDISSLFHALVIGTLGLWLFYKLVPVRALDLEEVVLFGLFALPLIVGLRVALRVINLRLQGPERVFALAPPEDVRVLRRKLANHPEYEMELVGTVDGEQASEDGSLCLATDLERVKAMIAAGQIDHLLVRLDSDYLPQEMLQELMHACHRVGVRFGCFPAIRTLLLPGTQINHVEGMGILTCDPPVLSRASRLMKRGLDIALSALMLVLLAPLMAALALAIRLDSKGAALFRQVRVGKDGRRFWLIKFRTMVAGADRMTVELMEESSDPDWLDIEDDPRVTRLGRILRRSSLDELPQLWNVLRGEMSLVGPRPLSEHDDEGVHGWRRNRLDLVPGITGPWQILGRTSIPFKEMLEVDYAYIASWSMWYDLKLLLRTVPAVLRRRGVN